MIKPIVTITMDDGSIINIELYPNIAPETVNNFVSLVSKGFYDGLTFHRVIPGFMIVMKYGGIILTILMIVGLLMIPQLQDRRRKQRVVN